MMNQSQAFIFTQEELETYKQFQFRVSVKGGTAEMWGARAFGDNAPFELVRSIAIASWGDEQRLKEGNGT